MTEAFLLALCAVLAVAVLVLAVALRRVGDRAATGLASLRADVERRLATLEAGASAVEGSRDARSSTDEQTSARSSTDERREYVITRVGDDGAETVDTVPVDRPDAKLFADLVLRESVVKAASFAHGVRRGLSPENRNKMWFEMRREVKRARKQRRADLKGAQRDWKARQRAALDEDDAA